MGKKTVGKFIRGQCQLLNPASAKELFFTYNECQKTCATGMSFNSYRKRCSEIFRGYVQANTPSDTPSGVVSSEIQKDTIKQTVVLSTRFTTAEELAKYCDIDLSVWEASKIVTNQWGKDESPLWQFKVIWARIKGLSPQMVLDTMRENLQAEGSPDLPEYEKVIGNVCAEVNIPDIHLGRLAWHHESGEDYDSEIAYDEWIKAHQYFYESTKHLSIEKVIIPIGNDFFNCEGATGETTKGTRQVEDGRWQRSFNIGCRASVDAIEFWRSKGFQIEIKIIPGNHDMERIYYLGEYLVAWYKDVDSVVIDNAPRMRKYVVYGRNLIGFSHGQADYKRLKTVYQSEMREHLSTCDCIEFHVGHTHQEKVVEDFGSVIIRSVPSLAQKGNWEYEMGYTGNRRAQAFVWDKKKGLMDIIYYTPDFLDK